MTAVSMRIAVIVMGVIERVVRVVIVTIRFSDGQGITGCHVLLSDLGIQTFGMLPTPVTLADASGEKQHA
jgi:hypothetical protein